VCAVTFAIQHAVRMRALPVWLYNILPHYLTTAQYSEEKKLT
jgi:hypothetical protein